MSHAQTYLRSNLTPDQRQEYRRLAAQGSRDSTARQKWRFVRQYAAMTHRPAMAQSVATARAWLLRNGYVDAAGAWTGKTTES